MNRRNCTDIEALLCDWVDGTLSRTETAAVEQHLSHCAACGELAREAAATVAFLRQIEPEEPPEELVTRILKRTASTQPRPVAEPGGGLRAWIGRLFEPIRQPRLVMGMAMTILSFSMIGRFAGIPQRPLSAADLDPAKIWSSIDSKVHRAYDRAVKYYENLRLVYEIQNRLSEWSEQEQFETDRQRNRQRIEPAAVPPMTETPERGDAQ